jgi:hypothetical protein
VTIDATQESAVAAMEACINDVQQWMVNEKLMNNDDKTEFLLIGTSQQLTKVHIDCLSIGNARMSPSKYPIKNLGAWFDRI